jgi:hypothetical protein
MSDSPFPRLNQKPSPRTKTLGVRISEADYAAMEQRAWKSGKTLADWARDILERGLRGSHSRSLETHIFTELVAIQLLLMNGLEPLLNGDRLSREQVASVFREVQATKAMRAQDLLKKRSQMGEGS